MSQPKDCGDYTGDDRCNKIGACTKLFIILLCRRKPVRKVKVERSSKLLNFVNNE